MQVFYVRCSTLEQNEARQLKMAEDQKAETIFVDKASGKDTERNGIKPNTFYCRVKENGL